MQRVGAACCATATACASITAAVGKGVAVEGVVLRRSGALLLDGGVEGLDDEVVEDHLVLCALEDVLLDGVLRDEAVDVDELLLPDAVAARLRLQVVLRVPVRVEDDHRVRRREVDAEPARAGGEEEDEVLGAGLVEAVHRALALLAGHRAVEPLVLPALQAQVLREDVEHPHHLREDEHAVPGRLQPLEQLVEQHHLAGGVDERAEARRLVARRDAGVEARGRGREEERVVAELLQLDDDVQQGGAARALHALVERREVARDDVAVVLALERRLRDAEDELLLLRQVLLDVALDAPQQVRLDELVQLGDLVLVGQGAVPPLELVQRRELLRHQEVQQRPELADRVLQGRARDQQAELGAHLLQARVQLRVEVLQAVRLVHDHVEPADLPEELGVRHRRLERREQHVEADHEPRAARADELVLAQHLAALGVARVHDDVERRAPLAELAVPVAQRRQRHDHDVRAAHLVALADVRQERDRLHGLPQPHLVREDPVAPPHEAVREPVHPVELVLAQRPADDGGGLPLQRRVRRRVCPRQDARPRPRLEAVVLGDGVREGGDVRALLPRAVAVVQPVPENKELLVSYFSFPLFVGSLSFSVSVSLSSVCFLPKCCFAPRLAFSFALIRADNAALHNALHPRVPDDALLLLLLTDREVLALLGA